MATARVDLESSLTRHRRKVDTEYFDLSLREIVRMVEEEEIRIAPEYQRQFRWNDETQSALIESFLLGLPIPSISCSSLQTDGTPRLAPHLAASEVPRPLSSPATS